MNKLNYLISVKVILCNNVNIDILAYITEIKINKKTIISGSLN